MRILVGSFSRIIQNCLEKQSNEKKMPKILQGYSFLRVDEKSASSSNSESSEFNCSSSVTSDEGGGGGVFGTRAPGLVARLMGLDSLPTSNAVQPHFLTPAHSVNLKMRALFLDCGVNTTLWTTSALLISMKCILGVMEKVI